MPTDLFGEQTIARTWVPGPNSLAKKAVLQQIHYSRDQISATIDFREMNEIDKNSFAESLLSETYDLRAIAPVDPDEAIAVILTEIDAQLSLDATEVRERRYHHFKVPKTTVDDFAERIIGISQDKTMIAGIRHVGGNPNLPFVHVTPNFNIGDAEIGLVTEVLRSEFRVFEPTHFAFWSKVTTLISGKVIPARRYLAARIQALSFAVDRNPHASWKVVPVTDENYWPTYQAEYQLFHDKNPHLKSWVTMGEKCDLERYRSQCLLYSFWQDDEFAGLIGGERSNLLGLSGLYVGELLITGKFQGRGLAPVMQRLFLDAVKGPFEVVWGTIDARNIPSTKTALRVGREPLRTEYFAPLG